MNQKLEVGRYSKGQLAIFIQDYHDEPIAKLLYPQISQKMSFLEIML